MTSRIASCLLLILGLSGSLAPSLVVAQNSVTEAGATDTLSREDAAALDARLESAEALKALISDPAMASSN